MRSLQFVLSGLILFAIPLLSHSQFTVEKTMAGGQPWKVIVDGNYAYTAGAGSFAVLDISNPANIKQLSFVGTPDSARDLTMSGNYVYVAESQGTIRVIDVSNPHHPVQVEAHDNGDYAFSIAGKEDYLYVGTGGDGVQVYDTDPSLNKISPDRMSTVSTNYLKVCGDVLFTISGNVSPRLSIRDLSDPANPQHKSSFSGGYPKSVDVVGNYAYIIFSDRGLEIYDLTDLSDLTLIGSCTYSYLSHIAIQGNYAYVSKYNKFVIFNISDPAHPTFVAEIDAPWDLSKNVEVAGTVAYVSAPGSGITAVNISDVNVPVIMDTYQALSITDVKEKGEHAFLADGGSGIHIWDVSTIDNPLEVTTVAIAGVHNIAIAENTMYVANGDTGFRSFNVADVSNPVELDLYGLADTARDVVVKDNTYAYIATHDRLYVFNVSDPSDLRWIASSTDVKARAVALEGDKLCVGGWDRKLTVFDISNGATLVKKGSHAVSDIINEIVIRNNLAYATSWNDGLVVIDISDPDHPVETDRFKPAGLSCDVEIEGNYAFVGDYYNGVRVIDISNPYALHEVDYYASDGGVDEIAIVKNRVIANIRSGGAVSLSFVSPTPTLTATQSATYTSTPSITPTSTPSPTVTTTATLSPTVTITPTATQSATYSCTPTITVTSTASPTATATLTVTATSTGSPTMVMTQTSSPTSTVTVTAIRQKTYTPTATEDLLKLIDLKQKKALAFPNPARHEVTFVMHLNRPSEVAIHLYNIKGDYVAALRESGLNGQGQVMKWDSTNVAPGLYIAKVVINGEVKEILKVAIVK